LELIEGIVPDQTTAFRPHQVREKMSTSLIIRHTKHFKVPTS